MKRITTLFAALAIASLALGGCGKDKKDGEPAAKPADPAAVAPADPAAAAPADPAAAAPADPAAAAPAAAAGDMSDEQLAEKSIAMMEAMAAAASANKDNCDGMADAMKVIVEGNKDLIAQGKKFDQDEEKKKWFEEKYKDKAEAAAKAMIEPMMACGENAKLQEVFKSLE